MFTVERLLLFVVILAHVASGRDLTPTIKELNAIFDEDLANYKHAARHDLTLPVNETFFWQEVLLPYMFDVSLKVQNCTIESAWQRLDRSVS